MARICVVILAHFYDDWLAAKLTKLAAEAPADHAIFLASSDGPESLPAAIPGIDGVFAVTDAALHAMPYATRCAQRQTTPAEAADLLQLLFWQTHPDFVQYWFIEYDVEYCGDWGVLFNRFRASEADLLATKIVPLSQTPRKAELLEPRLSLPPALAGRAGETMLAFFPICRFSPAAFRCLDTRYREGIVGHYEMTLATCCFLDGLVLEDFGGNGPFVRPHNRNRFYFCTPHTFSHSPGSFVFRPVMRRALMRRNTLWHPIKPDGVRLWYPRRLRGNLAKTTLEMLKPLLWHVVIWLWFATLWRPLRDTEVPISVPPRGQSNCTATR